MGGSGWGIKSGVQFRMRRVRYLQAVLVACTVRPRTWRYGRGSAGLTTGGVVSTLLGTVWEHEGVSVVRG